MKAIKRIDVQLSGNSLQTPVKVVAGDTAIQLILHYTDFTIPVGTTATLFVRKPSKKFVYQTDEITITGNTVTINVKNQAIIESGEAYFTVTLKNGEDEISTFSNYFDIDRNNKNSTAEESKTVITGFEEMLERYLDNNHDIFNGMKITIGTVEPASGLWFNTTGYNEISSMLMLNNDVTEEVKAEIDGQMYGVQNASLNDENAQYNFEII